MQPDAHDDMTIEVFEALQTCITLARYQKIKCFDTLKQKALEAGHATVDVDAALKFWAMPDSEKQAMYGASAPGRHLH